MQQRDDPRAVNCKTCRLFRWGLVLALAVLALSWLLSR